MELLGRAVLVGHHRHLIESLDSKLGYNSLVAMASVSIDDTEICSAFSVYLTTLEQAYHWPRECTLVTPEQLENHKLVIQMLQQPELRGNLLSYLNVQNVRSVSHSQLALSALGIARRMIEEASQARHQNLDLPIERQDLVNLLYRTSRGDWFIQGDYTDRDSHLEFGQLHEVIRTNGTQRSVQEIFERFGGLTWLQRIPNLHQNFSSNSNILCAAYIDLQVAVALARDELFSMVIDEPIWGQTFAKFSKGVGFCTIGAGGADCPMFRMMDALCGRVDNLNQSALLDELDFRSRFFPPNMRALINDLVVAPSIRAHVDSGQASYELSQAFRAMEQVRYDLYEMHRKKAMRIALALRAGQQATSSGIQNASSPEKHIATTLSAAIRVRFGQDAANPRVNAFAWSSPLLRNDDGQIQAARIQLVFSTPLAVSPGDSLSVAVEVEQGTWHTRTYSITHAYARQRPPKDNSQPCQAVGSAEICVRNKGHVSSFLCNQETGFPVRVMIKPSPHFRIIGNTSSHDETLFVAQGGAVGVFLAWLAWQTQLVGSYKLVVGARDCNMLAYASQLQKISTSFGNNLVVHVALSKPGPGDVQSLLLSNINAFIGRVNNHLDLFSSNKIKTTYVCGSSSFALGVVHRLTGPSNAEEQVTKGSRLQAIVTSRLPSLRLHVAAAAARGDLDKSCTRQIFKWELALHNSPGDLWIALGDRVFDISAVPSFHPGGEKVLMYRAGRQALDVFETVHDGCYMTNSLLNEMEIARLIATKGDYGLWEDWLDKIVEIQNDLTNHSRIEQAPTGSRHQLAQSPPVEILRGCIDCFVKGWSSLLERIDIDDTERRRFLSAHQQAISDLKSHLEMVYESDFEDLDKYAVALQNIFDAHAGLVGDIHFVIDKLKADIVNCFKQEENPQMAMLGAATARISRSLKETSTHYRTECPIQNS
ncbi:cytochrome b5-like Heme steroid binding domain protein [Fusarium beomiforme]|uniref:Cytochrome b5-like Heme steroid binding domain protein n=1 Tax=Fusarium beomiforme TaxID=44412 RepID=A0A9P5A786_9HYPO|nr:cytochrome b5-like Heme steroid binding domain protein [Fusarium beomiforme]